MVFLVKKCNYGSGQLSQTYQIQLIRSELFVVIAFFSGGIGQNTLVSKLILCWLTGMYRVLLSSNLAHTLLFHNYLGLNLFFFQTERVKAEGHTENHKGIGMRLVPD